MHNATSAVSRDPRRLRVFHLADALIIDVYRATAAFPSEERYGLQAQLRRASLSAASNIVEGCARKTTRDYLSFLTVATGSAAEARYLVDVSFRLEYLPETTRDDLDIRYTDLLKGLQKLVRVLEGQP